MDLGETSQMTTKPFCEHEPKCKGVREHLLTMGDFKDVEL
jgi:hypothetical protein